MRKLLKMTKLRFLGHARTLPFTVGLVAAACVPMMAQAQAAPSNRVDLAVTYAAAHSVHAGSSSTFWLQGGAVELHAQIFRGLGVTASGTGLHVASNNPLVAPLDLVTITFGPRYTLFPDRRVSVFGEALVGEADGFHSLFAYGSGPVASPANGTTTSANSLAVQAGGGIDLRLTLRFAIRVIQADYLRTQLPNGGTNLQNNLRLAAGIDIRIQR
jgi:hypothetical protein